MVDRLDPQVSWELALTSLSQTKYSGGTLKDVNLRSYHDRSFVNENVCFHFGNF